MITENNIRELESSIGNKLIFPSELFDVKRGESDEYTIINKCSFNNLLDHYRYIFAQMLRSEIAGNIRNNDNIVKDNLAGTIEMEMEMSLTDDAQYEALEITKNNLIHDLLSGDAIKPDIMLILSDQIDVDIYLLRDIDLIRSDCKTNPLYGSGSLHKNIKGPINMRAQDDIYINDPERNAIVIISSGDFHYELIGRVDSSSENDKTVRYVHTSFQNDEPLIRSLYEYVVKGRTIK